MCDGEAAEDLAEDFNRRVTEREFPIAPPKKEDSDGPLTYTRAGAPNGPRWFHNGGLFGLTRWTNLYFPVSELFRGDAIGGPVADVFGHGIVDVALDADSPRGSGLSAHIRYWYLPKENPLKSAHICELRRAIDLKDTGAANYR
jgi:hypothetical protein